MPRVEIYTRSWCPYCLRAKSLLAAKGAEFEERDVERNPEHGFEMLERARGRSTVPQVFIDGRHVGGFDDLSALDRAGKLDPLLAGDEPT